MKWGWWRGYIEYAREYYPPVVFDEMYPFWAMYYPPFVSPCWWGVN